MSVRATREWAEEEFGRSWLKDRRRRQRLTEVVAEVAEKPDGTITRAMKSGAQRTGAYRLLRGISGCMPRQIAIGPHQACAERSKEHEFVFVPIDGTSLNITDDSEGKGLGLIGARRDGAHGMQVMTAIAVQPDGTPVGVCAQNYWTRLRRSTAGKEDKRRPQSRESHHWVDVMKQVRGLYQRHAPQCRPWYQLDRGGDCWQVLLQGLEQGDLFTVRASANRRLTAGELDEGRRYLWEQVQAQPVLARLAVKVAAKPSTAARTAQVEVRSCHVTLDLSLGADRHRAATVDAVLISEAAPPKGAAKLEWLLLTTYSVHTAADAKCVVDGYAQRWRIEEFHRVWKSGACNVERTQLRGVERLEVWATILASVAVRIMRISYLARSDTTIPAETEFDDVELMVLRALNPKAPINVSLQTAVTWLANLGGYTGKSSGGPPGPIVIGRGFEQLNAMVRVATALANQKM